MQRLDLAALRHHRLAGRQLGDDGGHATASHRAGDARRGDDSLARWPPGGASEGRLAVPGLAARMGSTASPSQTADWVLEPRRAVATASGKLADDYVMPRPDQGHAAHAGPRQGRAKPWQPASWRGASASTAERGTGRREDGPVTASLILFSLGITRRGARWSTRWWTSRPTHDRNSAARPDAAHASAGAAPMPAGALRDGAR